MNMIVNNVITAIRESYATSKPEAEAMMNLYTTIGKAIAVQEDTSIVLELAKVIIKECSEVKGFSARNLRRMRDFYVTYSSDETLMEQAQTIGWTQNTVIMESCSSLEEMAFYITLVKEEGLSKVALMTAMKSNAFETVKRKKLMEKTSAVVSKSKKTACTPVAPVSHSSQNASKDTIGNVTKKVSPPVGNVKPFLQGARPSRERWRKREKYQKPKRVCSSMDWAEVVPKEKLDYIMGNPPFVGFTFMNSSPKEDMLALFPKVKNLDFVAGWYKKASDYIQGTRIECGFVSTNSITQGEPVSVLWNFLNITINYAYQTFKWESEASDKAGEGKQTSGSLYSGMSFKARPHNCHFQISNKIVP